MKCFCLYYDCKPSRVYDVKRRFNKGQRNFLKKKRKRSETSRITDIRTWIVLFSEMNGCKQPDKEEIHLPLPNLASLVRLLNAKWVLTNPFPVSYQCVRRIMKESLSHIRIRKWKKFTRCATCERLERKYRKFTTTEAKEYYQNLIREHVQWVEKEKEKYAKHRGKARSSPHKYMSVIIDGMDQAKCELPRLSRDTKGNVLFIITLV